jgi:hypothetical protein
MKDLGPLHHFLGVSVEQRFDDLFLHQSQYAWDILEHAGMSGCKPYSTPVNTQAKVSPDMGGPSMTRLPTATWLGLSSTSPSLGPTLPTRSSRCASTCTTPMSPISRPRSASFDTSRAPSTIVCFFVVPLRRTSSSTLMLTGPVVPTLTGPLRATRCSWVTTSSPGSQSVRTSSLARALRRSTASWPTAWQRRAGFVSCLWSCTTPVAGHFGLLRQRQRRLPLHQPRSAPTHQAC